MTGIGLAVAVGLASLACSSDDASPPTTTGAPASTSTVGAEDTATTEATPAPEVQEMTVSIEDAVLGPLEFDALAAGDPAAAADGKLVLLLHGFPETAESYREFLAPIAAAGYYAVAPTQRGFSAGARPADIASYEIVPLMGDVFAMADALGADTFHLVGHDWGGGVAWVTAGLGADRVTSLTVLSTPHPDAIADAFDDPSSGQAEMFAYQETFRSEGYENALLADGPTTFVDIFSRTGMPKEAAETYAEVLGTPEALGAALNWYRANPLPSAVRLGPVAVPTLYIWGTEDIALGRFAAEATANYVDGPYEFVEMEGAGHWLPETDATEIVQRVLDQLEATGS